MTNILSRKGVAFGAIVALGTTLIAGSPAMAADELALAPTTGTEVLMPTGMDFGMKTNYVPGRTPTDATKIKFKVTTAGGIRLNIGAGSSAAIATAKLAVGTAIADNAAGVLANTDVAADAIISSATTAVVTGGASVSYLALDTTAANTETANITVQSWEDVNDNNTIDSGEYLSPVRTMTFLKHTDITWTPTLVTPAVAATSAEVRITSNINLSQLRSGIGGVGTETNTVVRFDKDPTPADTFVVVGTAPTAPTYNADDNRLVAVSDTTTALAAGDRVKASVFFNPVANDIATAVTGWTALIAGGVGGTYAVPVTPTGSGIAVASTTATVLTPSVTALTAVNSVANANVSSTVAAVGTALAGTANFTVRTTATPNTGQSAAGIPVTFTISESGISSLATAARIVAGGATLANTNAGTVQTLDVIVNTDADGIASLPIAATGTVDGNIITVVAKSQGSTGTLATYTFRDRAIGTVSDIFAIGTSAQRVVAVETAFDVPIGVVDQFGAPVSTAGFSVSVSDGTSTVFANVVNGVATANFPKYTTAGTRTLTVTGLKNGVTTGITTTIAVKVGAQEAVSTINYTGTATGTGVGFGAGTDADLGLNTETFIDVDTRTGGLAPDLDVQYTTVNASTFNASSTAVSADVTFSGTGLDFVSGGVYRKGSITVRSTDAGLATVRVYSSVAGSKTLTIASGTTTRTQSIVHLSAGVGTATQLMLNAPASVLPGQSLTVSGTLKDAFGNGVAAGTANNFRITYAGPGFTTSIPTSVDADGTFTFNVVTSTLDAGTGTVTVKYDQNADGDYTDSTDLTMVKTFIVGRAALNVINGATINGRVYVTVNNAIGYRVWVKIGYSQKPTFIPTSAKKLVSYFVGAGKRVAVRVYVRGGIAYSQNVVVK